MVQKGQSGEEPQKIALRGIRTYATVAHRFKISLGGSFVDSADGSWNHMARVSTRMGNTADSGSHNSGFRCARDGNQGPSSAIYLAAVFYLLLMHADMVIYCSSPVSLYFMSLISCYHRCRYQRRRTNSARCERRASGRDGPGDAATDCCRARGGRAAAVLVREWLKCHCDDSCTA